MKKRPFTAFVLIACLFATTLPAQQEAHAKPPFAVVSTNHFELGTINSYDIQTRQVRITNIGGSPLTIQKLVSTCTCVSGSISTNVLQPHAEGIVTICLDAKQVHGEFKRGLWIDTDSPETQRISIGLTGKIQPLFDGLPPMPITFRSATSTAVWTNVLNLTASEANWFLDQPTIQSNDSIKVDVAMKTNAAEKMSYTITSVIKPLTSDYRTITLVFPAVGKAGTMTNSVKIKFQTRTDVSLTASPNRFLLNSVGATPPKRIVIHTTEQFAQTDLLTWKPEIKGVHIAIADNQGLHSNIILTISVSKETTQKLLTDPGTVLTFSYPNHKPVNLPFIGLIKKESAQPTP